MKIRSFHYLLGEGFRNVWSHRLMSIASAGVLMACMLMIGIMSVISLNIDSLVKSVGEQSVVMVFFEDDMSREEAKAVSDSISKITNVKTCKFVSREDGLERAKSKLDQSYVPLFDWVKDENPLPDACQVTLEDLAQFDKTVLELRSTEGVQSVGHQKKVAGILSATRDIIRNVGVSIIILLMVIALMIVSNTIKITMYARKLEINIMKAVGATDGFIRMPFVIEGMILGVVAGITSTGVLYFLYKFAQQTLVKNFGIVTKFVPFTSFALPMFIGFVLVGSVIGSLGSVISIGKYLRHEGSEFNAIT